MNNLNLDITKVCRTCLEQRNELISLYSVDNITGIQLCDMILQITSQVQVICLLYAVWIYVKILILRTIVYLSLRYLPKKIHHLQYVLNVIIN